MEVRHWVALLQQFCRRQVGRQRFMVRMRKLPGVVAAGLGAGAVCFIGKIQTNPKIFRGRWSESVRGVGQEDIDVRDRRHTLEAESFAIRRGKR